MNTRGLWLPGGGFHEFSDASREALLAEVATRQTAGWDLGSGMSTWLGLLPDPDPVLRKRGGDASILEELLADDQVTMAIAKRKLKVLNRQDYGLSPGHAKGDEPDQAAIRLCEDLEADLENLDLRDLFAEILDAPYFGMTVVELLFEPAGGRLRLANAVAKPREWFGFDSQGQLVFRAGLAEPQLVDARKFVLARHSPTYRNPYGVRLLSRCLWPVAFKRGGIEFWMRFSERFGAPWTIATAAASSTRADRQGMAADLANMVRDAVAVLPQGYDVKLHESTGKSGDVHGTLVRYWDAAVAKVLNGGTLSSDLQGAQGSRAAAETHQDELGDLADADAAMLVSAMNDLCWCYSRVNAPDGVRAPVFGFSEPEDLQQKADLAESIRKAGGGRLQYTAAYFQRHFGLSEDEFEIVQSEEDDQAMPGGDFAAPDGKIAPGQAEIEALVAEVLPEAQKAADGMAGRIAAIIERAESYDDLAVLLAEELGTAEGDAFQSILERAVFAADMWGRVSAKDANG